MYLPAHFNESRTEILQQCIARHPFGILITHGKGGLDANHLPFELAANEGTLGVLRAHVARANPLWQQVANGDEVLVVFRAGDGYVSPNWYPSKHESHRQVPTWNDIVVHAYGRIHVHDDERFVRGVVARLTRSHEAAQAKPWQMSDAPATIWTPRSSLSSACRSRSPACLARASWDRTKSPATSSAPAMRSRAAATIKSATPCSPTAPQSRISRPQSRKAGPWSGAGQDRQ